MAAKSSRCLSSKKVLPIWSTHHNVGIGKIQKAHLGGTATQTTFSFGKGEPRPVPHNYT